MRLHLALARKSDYGARFDLGNYRRKPHISSTPALDGPANQKWPSL